MNILNKPHSRINNSLIIALIVTSIILLPAFIFNRNKTNRIDQKEMQRLVNAMEHVKQFYHKELSDKELVDSAIAGVFNNLDAYSSYLDAEQWQNLQIQTSGTFSGVGLVVTMDENHKVIIVSPIDNTPAAKAGMETGDIITKINDQLIETTDLNKVVDAIQGKIGTKISISVLRDEQELTFDLTRAVINVSSIASQLLENDIAYIRIAYFQETTTNELKKAITKLSATNINGLIIDLRNNPGGLLESTSSVADLFLDSDTLPDNPLIVYTQSRWQEGEFSITSTAGAVFPDVPIIILINKGSASGAEIVAASLKDHERALLLGETTFGKGSVQTIFPANDEAVKLTTALYFSPKGNVINDKGVQPNITVTAEGEISYELDINYHNKHIAELITIDNEFKQDDDMQLAIAIAIMENLIDKQSNHTPVVAQ